MDVYRTEEEQVAAIKAWWVENGVKVVVAALLAVGSFLGWKWYQAHEREQTVAAAGIYQSLMKSYQEVTAGDEGAADADARMVKAAAQLTGDYDGTPYARFAQMILAGRAVELDDLPGAEKQLRAVLDANDSDALAMIATHRLAQVVSAQGRHDDALKLLAGEVSREFVAARADVRGDVLIAQGKRAEAHAAWQKALDASDPKDPARQLLEMKLAYAAGQ